MIKKWRDNLASGHTETWLATLITVWAILVVIVAWYLVVKYPQNQAIKWILAGIILYEVLP